MSLARPINLKQAEIRDPASFFEFLSAFLNYKYKYFARFMRTLGKYIMLVAFFLSTIYVCKSPMINADRLAAMLATHLEKMAFCWSFILEVGAKFSILL